MVVWVKVVVGEIVKGEVEKVDWVITESEARFGRKRGIQRLSIRQRGIWTPFRLSSFGDVSGFIDHHSPVTHSPPFRQT